MSLINKTCDKCGHSIISKEHIPCTIKKGNDMKEIKFRAWSIVGKKFIDNPIQPLCVDIFTGKVNRSVASDYILQQYTGLKDKNGKEIFEGDILATIQRDVLFEVIHGWNSDQNAYGWNYKSLKITPQNREIGEKGHFHIYSMDKPIRLEVIGNVYENREL